MCKNILNVSFDVMGQSFSYHPLRLGVNEINYMHAVEHFKFFLVTIIFMMGDK